MSGEVGELPPGMERARWTPSVIMTTADNWLAKVAYLKLGEVLWMQNGRGTSYLDAQAALDAQYGRSLFQAGNHGNALYVKNMRFAHPSQGAQS